jgi:hypothetical protein
VRAADLLGWADRVSSIHPGMFAQPHFAGPIVPIDALFGLHGLDRLALLDLQWDPTLNALGNPHAYHGPTDGQMLEMPGRAALKPVARG